MGNRIIRWGLMGAGAILDRFMPGADNVEDMEVVAIASRTVASAKRQADKFGISRVCTYEELANMDDIDVVYINTIHPAHLENALMAMNAGKNVLVEKPACVNASDFKRMAECAKKNDVFLMEAVWTRFFPMWKEIGNVIASEEIGKVKMLDSSFCFQLEEESPASRLLDVNQAGGSLLDVGVYNLNFANIILNKYPSKITGLSAVNTDSYNFGVDEVDGFIMSYDSGEIAVCKCAVRCNMPETAFIYGTKGYIEIPHFYKPQKAIIHAGEKEREINISVPKKSSLAPDEGYQYEIRHVNDCIRRGIKESDIVPLSHTEEILKECDYLRNSWGIRYPFE